MTAALIGFAAVFLLAFAGVPLAFAMLLAGVGGYAESIHRSTCWVKLSWMHPRTTACLYCPCLF